MSSLVQVLSVEPSSGGAEHLMCLEDAHPPLLEEQPTAQTEPGEPAVAAATVVDMAPPPPPVPAPVVEPVEGPAPPPPVAGPPAAVAPPAPAPVVEPVVEPVVGPAPPPPVAPPPVMAESPTSGSAPSPVAGSGASPGAEHVSPGIVPVVVAAAAAAAAVAVVEPAAAGAGAGAGSGSGGRVEVVCDAVRDGPPMVTLHKRGSDPGVGITKAFKPRMPLSRIFATYGDMRLVAGSSVEAPADIFVYSVSRRMTLRLSLPSTYSVSRFFAVGAESTGEIVAYLETPGDGENLLVRLGRNLEKSDQWTPRTYRCGSVCGRHILLAGEAPGEFLDLDTKSVRLPAHELSLSPEGAPAGMKVVDMVGIRGRVLVLVAAPCGYARIVSLGLKRSTRGVTQELAVRDAQQLDLGGKVPLEMNYIGTKLHVQLEDGDAMCADTERVRPKVGGQPHGRTLYVNTDLTSVICIDEAGGRLHRRVRIEGVRVCNVVVNALPGMGGSPRVMSVRRAAGGGVCALTRFDRKMDGRRPPQLLLFFGPN